MAAISSELEIEPAQRNTRVNEIVAIGLIALALLPIEMAFRSAIPFLLFGNAPEVRARLSAGPDADTRVWESFARVLFMSSEFVYVN